MTPAVPTVVDDGEAIALDEPAREVRPTAFGLTIVVHRHPRPTCGSGLLDPPPEFGSLQAGLSTERGAS